MADKITSFEDYVKKEVGPEYIHQDDIEQEEEIVKTPPVRTPSEEIPVSQQTMEIEIEDPFQFLNAEERDEYLRQRQKDLMKDELRERPRENAPQPKDRPERPIEHRKVTEPERPAEHRKVTEPERPMEHKRAPDPLRASEPERKAERPKHVHSRDEVRALEEADFEDDYDDEEYDEEFEEEYNEKERDKVKKPFEKRLREIFSKEKKTEKKVPQRKKEDKKSKAAVSDKEDADEGGINMDLVVRVASILTGIVILVFIVGLVKVKILDRIMTPDPDEVQTVVLAIPEGFTETGDTVVVTAEALNLRSVPSTESDETIIVNVPKGTEMKRIAISDDGKWALLEYSGQQVYGYMKYMEVKQ